MLLQVALLVAALVLAFTYLVGCLEFGKEEGKRDATLFNANPTQDEYKNKFHRQRLTYRGVVLALGVVAGSVSLLWCPNNGWRNVLPVVLFLWGAAVWNDEFTPTLNRERKQQYVPIYYVSPNADASFWDRTLTALAAYFLVAPSFLLEKVLLWSKRSLAGLWLSLFVIYSYTVLSR
jgi:hypothetical protein